jgi:hypothetical protein
MVIQVLPFRQALNQCGTLTWEEQKCTTSIEVEGLLSIILIIVWCFPSAISRYTQLLPFNSRVVLCSLPKGKRMGGLLIRSALLYAAELQTQNAFSGFKFWRHAILPADEIWIFYRFSTV